MKFELKSTRKEFRLRDEATGYCFDIVADYDPEFKSWSAGIAVNALGMRDIEGALDALKSGMAHALRMLTERPPQPTEGEGG